MTHIYIVVVLFSNSTVSDSATPRTVAHQVSLSFTISQNLLKLMSIELVMPFNHLILCCPLPLLSLSFLASRSFPVSQLFTSGGQSIGASAFSISPSNEYSGLISFRIDWFDLLAVQGTLKSLLQNHSSKVSILRCSANSHIHNDYWKNYSFDYTDVC